MNDLISTGNGILDTSSLTDFKKVSTASWDSMKHAAKLRLVNSVFVPKFSDDIVCRKMMDLSVTVSIQETSDNTTLSHMMTNADLDRYNVDIDQIFEQAQLNMENDKWVRITSFKDFALKSSSKMYPLLRFPKFASPGVDDNGMQGLVQDTDEDGNANILMLYSTKEAFGSSYAFQGKVINEVCNRFFGDNFYMLPMSNNFMMMVKQQFATRDGDLTIEQAEDDLMDMLYDFNDKLNKSWKNILSYNMYYYSVDDGGRIMMIK